MDGKRNVGIDCLRLVSMYLVVVLHVLGQGGVLRNAAGVQWGVAQLLETLAYCAVNCFGLISGYVGYRAEERPFRYRKYLHFWLQVFLYNFGITLLFYLLRRPLEEPVALKTLLRAALPVLHGYYWYVRAYTGLFFLLPWLNKLLRSLNRREGALMALTLVLLGAFGTIRDTFLLNYGHSLIWLVFLYLLGGWLKKEDIPGRLTRGQWGLLLLGSVLFTWLWTCFSPYHPTLFLKDSSPTVLCTALACLSLFARGHFGARSERVITRLAPAAFGVYLIHLQFLVWDYAVKDAFTWICAQPVLLLIPLTLAGALGIFVLCMGIDLFRLWLRQRLGLPRALDRLADGAMGLVKKVLPLL